MVLNDIAHDQILALGIEFYGPDLYCYGSDHGDFGIDLNCNHIYFSIPSGRNDLISVISSEIQSLEIPKSLDYSHTNEGKLVLAFDLSVFKNSTELISFLNKTFQHF